jgi:enterobacterial common antigen flippase
MRIRWIGAAQTSASAVVYSLVSRISILLVNVATGIIVARTLGPAGRGMVGAITLWPLVISGILTLGIPAALRYEIRQRIDRPADIYSSALFMSAILGVLASAVGFTLVPHLLLKYPPQAVYFAQGMMAFVPFMLCNGTLQAFYESQGDFKQSNAMIYLPPLLTLLGLVLLMLIHRLSPYTVPFIYESPFALITVITLIKLRHFLILPQNLATRVQSLLHYGLRAYGIDILNTLSGQIDQAMIVGRLSSASFGLYVVAINGSRILGILGTSLNTVLFPTAAGLDREHAIALVSRSARLVFGCTLLAGSAFVLVLPILFPLAYGKEYSSVIGLTRLLTLAVLFGTTSGTLNQAFMVTGKPEIATILQCVSVCMTVPLLLTFIPLCGLAGAAYAIDISSTLRFALVLISYPLFLRHGIPRLLPTRRDISELTQRLRHTLAS